MPKVSEAHRVGRRRQILDGARSAFARHGYEGATVPRLEDAIGLSRGAIFSYYPSKLDLFVALAEEDQLRVGELWLEEGFDGVVRHIGEDPEWIGIYLDVGRMLRQDPELRERWLGFNPEMRQRLATRFAELQKAGQLRNDLDLNSLGRFLGVLFDGLAVQQGAGYGIDVDGTIALVRSALAPK
jgi:TetR/AcrR family transcriptional regulator, transcriptional repressor of aconitase